MATNPIEDYINRVYRNQSRLKSYDAGMAAAITNARLSLADINRSYGRGREEAQIGYDQAAQEYLRQRDEAYKQNTGQFAGQGILRSGIFAGEQGKVADAYQRSLTEAAQRRTSSLEELESARLGGFNQIQRVLSSEEAMAIDRAQKKRAEEAQRRLEAQYRAQQAAMQQAAIAQQQAIMRQQLALANSAGRGGGGGGGGGGYYTLEDLFPGMFGAMQSSKPLREYSPKQGKYGARVRVM